MAVESGAVRSQRESVVTSVFGTPFQVKANGADVEPCEERGRVVRRTACLEAPCRAGRHRTEIPVFFARTGWTVPCAFDRQAADASDNFQKVIFVPVSEFQEITVFAGSTKKRCKEALYARSSGD